MPLRQTPAAALPHSAKRQPLLPLVTPSADARTNAAYMPPRQYIGISNTRALFMPLRQTPAATLPHSAKRQLLLPFVYTVHRRAHAHHVHIHAEALPRGQFRRGIRWRACARTHVGSFDVRALFISLRQSPAAALPHSAKRQLLLPLVNTLHRRAHAHHVHIHAEALPRGQFRRVRRDLAVRAHACVAARQYVGSFDVCTCSCCSSKRPRPLFHTAQSASRYFLSSTPFLVARTHAAYMPPAPTCWHIQHSCPVHAASANARGCSSTQREAPAVTFFRQRRPPSRARVPRVCLR